MLMQTSELLDTLRFDILRDFTIPPLWSDTRLIGCLNEAYLEFAEETLILRDATSEATTITLEAGIAQYEYSPVVLAILTARIANTTRDLMRVGTNELTGDSTSVSTHGWLEQINAQFPNAGTPFAFSTDAALNLLTVYPTPAVADAGTEIKLRVARLPLETLTVSELCMEVEIPRQYVMGIAHGAAAIAYSDQDSDGYDATAEVAQRTRFMGYIARAKRGAKRQMFQPITWGFGVP